MGAHDALWGWSAGVEAVQSPSAQVYAKSAELLDWVHDMVWVSVGAGVGEGRFAKDLSLRNCDLSLPFRPGRGWGWGRSTGMFPE